MKATHWKTGSFLFVLVLLACLKVSATTEQIYSSDKDIRVDIHAVDNTLEAEIFKGDVHLVRNIRLGLTLNGSNFDTFKVTGKKRSHFSDTWCPIWGKQSEVRNEYNRFIFSVKDVEDSNRKMNIIFRVYDDGVALRYEIPEQSSPNDFMIDQDLTSFAVAGERSFYTPNGERANIGPVRVSGVKEQFNRNEALHTPMVFVSDDSYCLAVHEAATFDFSYSRLKPMDENRFQFDMEASTGGTPAKTAWRVFMTGDDAGELLESNLLYNLNPPCAIEDAAWIKPGVSLWDWRARGAQVNGFTYEVSQEAFMRYVDFAAEKDIEYVLFDAGWYSKKGPTHSRGGMDMPEIIRYAESKGVGVLLYLDRRSEGNNDWDLEKVLKTWSQWGAKGIKYGFLGSECDGRQELEIDLDFLGNGAYELTQFSDGENASAFGDKEDYIVKGKTVHAGDTHHYKMAPGGGHCVLIKKK